MHYGTQRPDYVDFLLPCNDACPAGENSQAWRALAQDKQYEAAWRERVADNPMPSIHGRVCYHPCEEACNRKHTDSTVARRFGRPQPTLSRAVEKLRQKQNKL